MDIEHEYYYSDSFFAHSSIQYDHQLALATLGMVTAAFNTWASDAKYWANGDVGRENSLDAAYTKLGFGDVNTAIMMSMWARRVTSWAGPRPARPSP